MSFSRPLGGVLTLAILGGLALASAPPLDAQGTPQLSFFITSAGKGQGANLGGVTGADQHCNTLAAQVGSTKTWRAYLSAQARPSIPAVHARNRIGNGPWYNAKGVMVAKDVDDLHSDKNNLTKDTQLTEKGTTVNGRGDTPNTHDILTGSDLQGRAVDAGSDTTCNNWTSSTTGSALMGHHDRQGGGDNPTSWNSAHGSKGCSQANLVATGGAGLFYCFARD